MRVLAWHFGGGTTYSRAKTSRASLEKTTAWVRTSDSPFLESICLSIACGTVIAQ
ncbi:uncharacterized protein PHACADRAFT_250866 [Phanerochaete carnosa HHB-10118-sp]|uniref:Uncharacterized protein n=1 Tax=Phanerochaete carnosa (strain HHB-10118-sp) TaxID=650164 RepID=K5WKS4_PHACS|nr:uncharacterized protein PHACADRAFT_250866 [Phanerochaete carnosa HHB-10118-sp]EKM60015.1 hypothetical protein PHACADRAFT_250866 [Phanerochaete carnosa HHB-10118-sp]